MERIPDSLGFLVLTHEGAVLTSGGDLENDERTAGIIMNMVQTAYRTPLGTDRKDTIKRFTITWDTFFYAVTLSNNKIHVCKRRYTQQEPVMA